MTQPYAGLTDQQAYEQCAAGDAALQAKMLSAGSGANNQIAAALERAGNVVDWKSWYNSIAPTWFGMPQGEPVGMDGNPVAKLTFPPYVPKGARPTHQGRRQGQNT